MKSRESKGNDQLRSGFWKI